MTEGGWLDGITSQLDWFERKLQEVGDGQETDAAVRGCGGGTAEQLNETDWPTILNHQSGISGMLMTPTWDRVAFSPWYCHGALRGSLPLVPSCYMLYAVFVHKVVTILE